MARLNWEKAVLHRKLRGTEPAPEGDGGVTWRGSGSPRPAGASRPAEGTCRFCGKRFVAGALEKHIAGHLDKGRKNKKKGKRAPAPTGTVKPRGMGKEAKVGQAVVRLRCRGCRQLVTRDHFVDGRWCPEAARQKAPSGKGGRRR